MRRSSTLRVALAAGAAFSLAAGGGVSFADDVNINRQSLQVAIGSSNTFTVKLDVNNGGNDVDPVADCNATAAAPVMVTFTADDPWAQVTPGSVSLTDCITIKSVTVAVPSGTTPDTTKVWGIATGGRQDQPVTVTTGSGKDKTSTTEYVDSAYRLDFVNVHAVLPGTAAQPDVDGDGVPDAEDNCVRVANPTQENADGDALGNACDTNSFAPATVDQAADAKGTEGQTLTTGGSFTDADGNASLKLTADNAVGTFTDNGNGTFGWSLPTDDDVPAGVVTVTATDGEHAPATQSFAYAATNVAPVIGAVAASRLGDAACTVSVSAPFSDAGLGDTHDAVFAWGDGTTTDPGGSETSPAGATHTYAAAGTYTASVTVTDDDGGTATKASNTPFKANNTPSAILAPINTAGTRSSFKLGSSVPVKITVTGCDKQPVSTLTPTVNLVQGDTTADIPVNEAAVAEVPTNGKLMRWSTDQYIYNLSTKASQFHNGAALTSGTYTVSVNDPSFARSTNALFDVKK